MAAALLVAFFLVLVAQAPARAQAAPGYGTRVYEVSGSSNADVSLAEGGTYDLIVAANDPSGFVNATLSYSGSLAAQLNESGPAAVAVSLASGNYSLALSGHGRAALGWDFTDGAFRNFPVNETVSGFLRPRSAHVDVVVSLGNAQEIHLEVYDDHLLPVTEANVTASRALSVDLPAARATSALVIASAVGGGPQGVFGLAWSSPSPPAPGADLVSQIFSAILWIAVPVVFALTAFVLLRRRRGRFP